MRETLEGTRVKQWLACMKYQFTRQGIAVAKSDGYEYPLRAWLLTAVLIRLKILNVPLRNGSAIIGLRELAWASVTTVVLANIDECH